MVKKILKGIYYSTIGVISAGILTISYVSSLGISNELGAKFSNKIRNEQHLDFLLQKEKSDLGISHKNIEVFMTNDKKGTCWAAKIKNENRYIIHLPKRCHNINSLKHEVYHIADGHCKENLTIKSELKRKLKYYLDYEPKAILYATYNIKF